MTNEMETHCIDHQEEFGFCHFVVIGADGRIIDHTNPFISEGEYADLEILPDDEMPDLVTEDEIAFWDRRISA